MAEGVAHAPLVTDSDIHGGTDEDTGGTERRPMTPRECNAISEFLIAPRPIRSTPTCVRSACDLGGTVLPRLRSPRFLFASRAFIRWPRREQLPVTRHYANLVNAVLEEG